MSTIELKQRKQLNQPATKQKRRV